MRDIVLFRMDRAVKPFDALELARINRVEAKRASGPLVLRCAEVV